MFPVSIDQIEHLDNSFIPSYCVRQVRYKVLYDLGNYEDFLYKVHLAATGRTYANFIGKQNFAQVSANFLQA